MAASPRIDWSCVGVNLGTEELHKMPVVSPEAMRLFCEVLNGLIRDEADVARPASKNQHSPVSHVRLVGRMPEEF